MCPPWGHDEDDPGQGRPLELRHNFTAYDAAYVALAEALDRTLVTADIRLAASARVHTGLDIVCA